MHQGECNKHWRHTKLVHKPNDLTPRNWILEISSSSSATQEFTNILFNPKFQYCVHYVLLFLPLLLLEVGRDCVHFVRRPLFGQLYQLRLMDVDECGANERQGKLKYSEKTRPFFTLSTTNRTWPNSCSNLGPHGGNSAGPLTRFSAPTCPYPVPGSLNPIYLIKGDMCLSIFLRKASVSSRNGNNIFFKDMKHNQYSSFQANW
jgi:hypothetical protein